MANQRELPPEFISREEAYANALIEAAKFMLTESGGVTKRNSVKLNPKPMEIYDINGVRLFYDFSLVSGRIQLGTVRAIANKAVGSPVISVRYGQLKWNLSDTKKKIVGILRKKFSGYRVKSTNLVCYSYPKLGLLVNLVKDKDTKTVIFDVANYEIIPDAPRKGVFEGAYAWSFLDAIDRRAKNSRLKRYSKAYELTKRVFGKEMGPSIYKYSDLFKVSSLAKIAISLWYERKLQFCTHYDHDEEGSHHCFILHAQEVNDYCSVATCQMILCYYRYYYAQDDIAPVLGYSPGGCPADVSAGYESLSNNHILATYDTAPTWEKARDQIQLLQPMKSGVPNHARAIAGYSYNRFTIRGLPDSSKKLYVYDPWPWNADLKAGGDIYWESWDAITHTNYVNTELDY